MQRAADRVHPWLNDCFSHLEFVSTPRSDSRRPLLGHSGEKAWGGGGKSKSKRWEEGKEREEGGGGHLLSE